MSKLKSGMKKVKCSAECGESMLISDDAKAGTCWRCVNRMMAGPIGRLDNVPDEVLMNTEDNTDEYDDSVLSVPDESWND